MSNNLLISNVVSGSETGTILEVSNKDSKDGSPLRVTAILQRADAENQNGRIYPRRVLEREIEKFRNLINENAAYGELDHSDNSHIELRNVSHIFRDIWWEGDTVVGTCDVLSTPYGNILSELIHVSTVGFSSRGTGSVRKGFSGADVIGEDFDLVTFDAVSNPSTHGAVVRAINEGVERPYDMDIGRFSNVDRLVGDILSNLP